MKKWIAGLLLRLVVALVFMPGMGQAGESAVGAPGSGAFRYRYFKERRELRLDVARIAVRAADAGKSGAAKRADAVAGQLGVAPDAVEPLVVAGWFLVRVSAPERSADGIAKLVERAATAPLLDFVSPVFVDDLGGPLIVGPDLLIGFGEDVAATAAEKLLTDLAAGTVRDRDWTGMPGVYRVRSNSRDGFEVLAVANALADRPETRYAEPDMLFTGRGDLIPNDPQFTSCWGLHNTGQSGGTVDRDMDAPEAWNITTGSAAIKVVIIDVGVQQDHPDINQVPGTDTTSDGSGGGGGPVNTCDKHGTAVAGCVSAIINNNLGVVGVAPACKSASARTFISNAACDGSWAGFSSWTVNSLAWAESQGVRVSNNSNHYGFASSTIADKYSQTRANGMVHFAAAGNDASSSISYPSSLSSVNAVAALTRTGTRASFSNYGTGLDFSAPGESINSTDRTGTEGYASGDYAVVSGTSFASPYAAGVAALVLSVNPALSAANVEAVLQPTCVDLGAAGYETDFGWGFINAGAAVATAACGVSQVQITTQPASQTVCGGAIVAFSLTASGVAPISYQWRRDGVNLTNGARISGATGATLTISATVSGDAGNYDCIVTDFCGLTTSNGATLAINSVPTITQQPVSVIGCSGGSVNFSVTAGGGELAYQWRKGATSIDGATGPMLTLTGITTALAGTYSVVVSNACGTATSGGATLTVRFAPVIVSPPISESACVGEPLGLTVIAGGSAPLSYQWRKAGQNIAGATSNALDFAALQSGDAGSYDVVVTNSCGSITSAAVTLTVGAGPAITGPPADQSVCVGADASMTVSASGTAPLSYQWRLGGLNLVDGGRISGALTNTLHINPTIGGDSGAYDCVVSNACGDVASSSAQFTVGAAPAISHQPVDSSACTGATAAFSVSASGSGLSYQWRKSGANINGATGSVLTLTGVTAGSAGTYDVVITNSCGTATSAGATLAVGVGPVIISDPVPESACVGESVTLTVAASGDTPLGYQWRKDGQDIAGATSSMLAFNAVQPTDAGDYSVLLTNSCGVVLSATAHLTVNAGVSITAPPADQVLCDGAALILSASAAGTGPLSYQWQHDGAPLSNGGRISGADTPLLTIAPAASGDAGVYRVTVASACGAIESTAAQVAVRKIGDANCDGAVNNFDIDFFVRGLLDQPGEYGTIGGGAECFAARSCWGDINRSGAFNNFDIDGFVACVLSVPSGSCP